MAIELGTRVRDTVTGIEGVVVARAEYLHGVPRLAVDRVTGDDKLVTDWIEEDRVLPVDE